jgi:hypothetical protein
MEELGQIAEQAIAFDQLGDSVKAIHYYTVLKIEIIEEDVKIFVFLGCGKQNFEFGKSRKNSWHL